MSATSQLTDFSDLYTDLQVRVREQTGISATKTIAQRYINIALHDMHIGFGETFPWAERQATLVTQAEYVTGTITATKGSTTITGSSTLWDTNNDFSIKNMRVGGKIVIDGGKEVYEIATVASDTSATINATFTQTTVSAAGYVYFEDEYALDSDFLRPLDFQNFDIAGDIRLIGRKTFREQHPRNRVTGKPRVATIQDKAFSGGTTPVRLVRLWQPPDRAYSIPYAFVTNKLAVSSSGTEQTDLSADTDEPIVPLRYRHAIVKHALYNLWENKDDNRAQAAKAEYVDLMLRISGDSEIGHNRPRFAPVIGPYKSRARTPYRRRGGRFTTGDAFDEIRD